MSLNSYLWNLYKSSPEGSKIIALFKEGSWKEIADKFFKSDYPAEELEDLVNELNDFAISPEILPDLNLSQVEALFNAILKKGIQLQYPNEEPEDFLQPNSPLDFIDMLPEISMWLYDQCSTYFKPYFYKNQFKLVTQIADAFGMVLPDVPLKRYKEDRARYYWTLCKTFYRFQSENKLAPEEFCAFLYDFAPNYISRQQPTELPEPSQVWFVGGDKTGVDFEFLDKSAKDETSFWQGNEDTRRGDIVVMYCLTPRSYIHSIWRAVSDGIADPFFHYYSNIYIGHRVKVAPIHLNELKSHPYFSKHPLVRKNMQGINGWPLKVHEYKKLLDIVAAKGDDIATMPKLHGHEVTTVELLNEKDVERKLLEPFLKKLGYSEKDWIRQLTVRMGRGERNFPDYAFLNNTDKGFETAQLIIEAKYDISTNRDLNEAFQQAWSYAMRLESKCIVIVDKASLWIYLRKNGSFMRDQYVKKYWKQLEQRDEVTVVSQLMDKQSLSKFTI